MATLQDIINLANGDGGKLLVLDANGEPKLVILGIEDYQKLLMGKVKREVEEVEQINREIVKAQMEMPIQSAPVPHVPEKKAERKPAFPMVDLREEVIDPSFDFEAPKVEIDDL